MTEKEVLELLYELSVYTIVVNKRITEIKTIEYNSPLYEFKTFENFIIQQFTNFRQWHLKEYLEMKYLNKNDINKMKIGEIIMNLHQRITTYVEKIKSDENAYFESISYYRFINEFSFVLHTLETWVKKM